MQSRLKDPSDPTIQRYNLNNSGYGYTKYLEITFYWRKKKGRKDLLVDGVRFIIGSGLLGQMLADNNQIINCNWLSQLIKAQDK